MPAKAPTPKAADKPSREIARLLRDAINGGELSPGAKLPSERELAESHGVARNTAREAIRLLTQEGLVQPEHGRGVFVRVRPKLMRFGRRRYSRAMRQSGLSPFRAEVIAQGRTPDTECRSVTRISAPGEVAERLEIPAGTDVVRRENWYYADGEPMQVGTTYSPWAIVEGSPIADTKKMGHGSIYGRFEELGYPIAYVREEISARMPTHEEAAGLSLPDGVPVIDLWHTGMDDRRRPFEVTRFVMRADFTALDYDMPVED
ncbi:GntR family transcriptional regulator [Antribacter gilvus]|uniref:GntR family transcriptional regulator n=1 Tax=Antribacter gilvus TaxID=2304675 RepID=UPI000F785B57|nr:GntR family transcriptional regulator [Antribacter gilvus]